jgi:hypothetical protein
MHSLRTIASALVAGAIFPAAAQTAPAPDPTAVGGTSVRAAYQSTFAGYQPFGDPGEPDANTWQAANGDVAGNGSGHAGHGKSQPAPTPATSPHAGMDHSKEAK